MHFRRDGVIPWSITLPRRRSSTTVEKTSERTNQQLKVATGIKWGPLFSSTHLFHTIARAEPIHRGQCGTTFTAQADAPPEEWADCKEVPVTRENNKKKGREKEKMCIGVQRHNIVIQRYNYSGLGNSRKERRKKRGLLIGEHPAADRRFRTR